MADAEQLRMLSKGVETWNRWRQEHAQIRVDLSDVVVATRAGQGQISFLSSTAVFERNDVVYRVRFRSVFLMDKAIFASSASALHDQSTQTN